MSVDLKYRAPATAERDPRPMVAVPRRGISPALIAAIGLVAALLLFLLLETQRRSAQGALSGDEPGLVAYAPPPPLSIPGEALPETQYVPVVAARPVALAPSPAPAPPPPPVQMREPVEPPMPLPRIAYEPPPIRETRPPGRVRPATSGEPALVIDTSAEIPIGTLIPAVLETPIDTSRPGLARAIVARDARGLDGQRVLVPRGSRLIGEYQSDVRSGQSRVLVNWTRLIRPDGASIRLGVPSADEMGAAGIPGQHHSFFLRRFFNAALQTALSVGGNLAAGGAANTVVVGLPNSLGAGGQGGQGLISNDVRPKITVRPGTLFNVFVARELDLSGANPAQ